jgi:hypothetical protein
MFFHWLSISDKFINLHYIKETLQVKLLYNDAMKKLLPPLLIIAAITGCSVKTGHFSAKKELEYYGIYKGVLPCKGCMAITVTLKLVPPDKYTKRMQKIESSKEHFFARGRFFWDESGNIIILDDKSRYRVKKDALIFPDSGRVLKKFSLSRFIDHNASY